ncbi:hypothetical protein ACFY7Y_32465 [Streptomyces virginiae]|uniref:hypothetical protein n=1 Tax=Streptomyces TaxID=1883 RepID=UPI000B1F0EC7|nr:MULTISPECIES: hypothetical protein [Streptomyces]MCM9083167.1 hypothetical protein [Streptomyces spororaveus]MCX4717271.1 hypothetical protein [Streptomyces virginiae]MCX4807054.1 hypothetical protein [Streptomyces sp. NBC_01214]MCX5274989.1 hypothetical protein [Streptomyces virginiae]MCX5308943.1 hypothetical protein [Streptomyces sp. NBC_00160]
MAPQPEPGAEMTVADLMERLSAAAPAARVRLAINPFFPMAHKMGTVTVGTEQDGSPIVYLAEGAEAVQYGYLPRPVAEALTWMPPVEPPVRGRRLRAVSDDDTSRDTP